ncbi:MAG TPA: hypothetical protein VK152_07295 [Paludibacter sp.]|nr:hypothetical protein [Paludibacter sp.]
MKTKKIYYALAAIVLSAYGCSSRDDLNSSLKSALNANIQQLNTSLKAISSSDGYQVLAVPVPEQNAANLVKSPAGPFDSTFTTIALADIAGVYDYKALPFQQGGIPGFRFFQKTADNNLMVVRLPEEKVKHPAGLLHFFPSDTTLVNNYVITLSDYLYTYNRPYHVWDYHMASSINVKNTDAGNLQISSSNSKENGYKYSSGFEFADGYKASCVYSTGDTALSVYTISKGGTKLYEEKYTATKSSLENRHREMEYTLVIGDVKIVREHKGHGQSGLDSAKVYVNDVLQANAKVALVDAAATDGTDNSIVSKKRELQITFDDGTTATISQLLGDTSLATIRSLFATLRQAGFATGIVDWIAWDVYNNK